MTFGVNLPSPESLEPCASCGRLGANTLVVGDDHLPLCDNCAEKWRTKKSIGFWVPTEEAPPLSTEERFDELFKAARILLEERAGEDQIIPTLALANEIGQDLSHLVTARTRFVRIGGDREAWDNAADEFVRRYGSLRPVRV